MVRREGEHDAIVAGDIFEQVRKLLARNGRHGGREVRNRYGALLRGVLRCAACGCAMSHSYTRKGNRRYRYYVCTNAQKSGWDACPAPSVPAGEIEQFVVKQIRAIGSDADVVAATVRHMRRQVEEQLQPLLAEQAKQRRLLQRDKVDLQRLTSRGLLSSDALCCLADVEDRVRQAKIRLGELTAEIAALNESVIPEREVTAALAAFDPLWEAMTPHERVRLIETLIERVDFDGDNGSVSVTFYPTGIRALESLTEAAV